MRAGAVITTAMAARPVTASTPYEGPPPVMRCSAPMGLVPSGECPSIYYNLTCFSAFSRARVIGYILAFDVQ